MEVLVLARIIKDIISQDTTVDMEIKSLPGLNQVVIVVTISNSSSIKELANQACHCRNETR